MYTLILYVSDKGWMTATSVHELKDKLERDQFVSGIRITTDIKDYLLVKIENIIHTIQLYINRNAETLIDSMPDLVRFITKKFKNDVPKKFRDIVNFINETFSDVNLSYRLVSDDLIAKINREDFGNLWRIQLSMQIYDTLVCQDKRTIECMLRPTYCKHTKDNFEIIGEMSINSNLETCTRRIIVRDIKEDTRVIIEVEDEY